MNHNKEWHGGVNSRGVCFAAQQHQTKSAFSLLLCLVVTQCYLFCSTCLCGCCFSWQGAQWKMGRPATVSGSGGIGPEHGESGGTRCTIRGYGGDIPEFSLKPRIEAGQHNTSLTLLSWTPSSRQTTFTPFPILQFGPPHGSLLFRFSSHQRHKFSLFCKYPKHEGW